MILGLALFVQLKRGTFIVWLNADANFSKPSHWMKNPPKKHLESPSSSHPWLASRWQWTSDEKPASNLTQFFSTKVHQNVSTEILSFQMKRNPLSSSFNTFLKSGVLNLRFVTLICILECNLESVFRGPMPVSPNFHFVEWDEKQFLMKNDLKNRRKQI